MPLSESQHHAMGFPIDGWNVPNRHVKSNDTNQREPIPESNRKHKESEVPSASLRHPPVIYYPPPPYHLYDNYRDYYYHKKLPVRDTLPVQRVPRYPHQPDVSHGPSTRQKSPDIEDHKEKYPADVLKVNIEDGITRKKRKLNENDNRSMIEDAELLVTLFASAEKKSNDTKNQAHSITYDKSNGEVTAKIIPSKAKIEEESSPRLHPLSHKAEPTLQKLEEKSKHGSPRGSADSHNAPYANQNNRDDFPPHTRHPYARPPYINTVPPFYPNYNVPAHIPFPLDGNLHRPYHPPPLHPFSKFHHPYPHILPRPRENHFRPHPKEDGQYSLIRDSSSSGGRKQTIILKRKCAWRNCPELEQFLISNRDEYLKHSAMNYTSEQKKFNNDLTERLLEEAKKHGYAFDLNDFNFVTIRDRIRCFYKSYVQNCKKRGIAVGYDEKGNKKDTSSMGTDEIAISRLTGGSLESADMKSHDNCEESISASEDDDAKSISSASEDQDDSP